MVPRALKKTAISDKFEGRIKVYAKWSDNEAIKIGFRLYDRYGGTPSFLTAQAILDEIYKSYQNNKLVNIKRCPNHWHHF